MEIVTFRYDGSQGWSRALPAELDGPATLVTVFGAPKFGRDTGPLAELKNALPRSLLIGCSTAGEILDASVFDDSIVVAVTRFHHTRLVAASVGVAGASDSAAAGEALGRAIAGPGLQGLFVLSDGTVVNGSALVRGLTAVLPPSVAVTGGLAADGDRFQHTWVLRDGEPVAGAVCAVGFVGERTRIGHGSRGGWDLFGPERTVTRADGNILFELDGRPALELYKRYLGERAAGLPATALLFPLSVRMGAGEDQQVVRTVLSVDEARNAMIFAGDVPEGARVRLMHANFERLVQGASAAGRLAHRSDTAGEVLSIAISCVGRRLVLGERVDEEVEATLDVLPRRTRQVGFYSYGEISPFTSGRCELHNQTMTLTTVAEA